MRTKNETDEYGDIQNIIYVSRLNYSEDYQQDSFVTITFARWHFFWQDVCDRMIDVIYVETKEQQADYIIKGIPAQVFVYLHLKVWPYKVGYSLC